MVALLALWSTTALSAQQTRRFFAFTLPAAAGLDIWQVFFAQPEIPVTIGGHAAAGPWRATARELEGNPVLWRRMHLADWNAVPTDLRERGLATMLERYGDLVTDSATWPRMTPTAWDFIPQPIRIAAYRQMVRHWTRFYGVGARHGLSVTEVEDVLTAIVMSESWFDHRAGVTYPNGNRDVGLGQASDFARDRLRELLTERRVDAAWGDDEYSNPWHATRFVALWMSLMLEETDGDLSRAVRAYNRGIARAHDALGTAYLQTVQQRLTRYIRNVDAPVAWQFVWRRVRALEPARD
jgi:hypothetical protein